MLEAGEPAALSIMSPTSSCEASAKLLLPLGSCHLTLAVPWSLCPSQENSWAAARRGLSSWWWQLPGPHCSHQPLWVSLGEGSRLSPVYRALELRSLGLGARGHCC